MCSVFSFMFIVKACGQNQSHLVCPYLLVEVKTKNNKSNQYNPKQNKQNVDVTKYYFIFNRLHFHRLFFPVYCPVHIYA